MKLAWGAQEDEQVMSMRATIVALNASLESYQVFFFTLVTGPRRSLSLKLSDTRVYAPQIRGPSSVAASERNGNTQKVSRTFT